MCGGSSRSRSPSIPRDLPKALFQSGDFSKQKKMLSNSDRLSLKDDIKSINKSSVLTCKLNLLPRIRHISNKENIDLNVAIPRKIKKNGTSSKCRIPSMETSLFNFSPINPEVRDVEYDEDDVFLDNISAPITLGTPTTTPLRYFLSTPNRKSRVRLSSCSSETSAPLTQGTPTRPPLRYFLSTPNRKSRVHLNSCSSENSTGIGTPTRPPLRYLLSTPNRKFPVHLSSCSSETSVCPLSYSEEYSSSPYISRSICICTPGKRRLETEGLCTEKVVLGHGAYGTVALGRWRGAKVAVKVMEKEKGLRSNRRRKSLEGELQACKMNHDNVLKVYNICAAENMYAIIVMEYVGSKNLNRLLLNPEKHLPAEWLLQCGFQVASALQHCHDRGVVHMDVKPANILITSSGLCKLGDFGCSVSFDCPNLEMDNALVGTPGYQAPEFLRGGLPSPPCDIYSLGIMLWQLDSRETPFQGVHAQTVMFKVVSAGARPSPPPKHVALVGREDFTSLYRQCWAQDAAQRPFSSKVADQLAKMAQHSNKRPSEELVMTPATERVKESAMTVTKADEKVMPGALLRTKIARPVKATSSKHIRL